MQEQAIAPAVEQAHLKEHVGGEPAGLGPAFLTVDEVADLLRVDAVTIYRAVRARQFPAIKVRKRYIVPRRVIELLVEDVVATGACVDTAAWTARWGGAARREVPPWVS